MSPNRRIEADRRQRRFATLAPSAHAGRCAAFDAKGHYCRDGRYQPYSVEELQISTAPNFGRMPKK